MAKLIVVTRDGTEHEIEGDTSLTVMENIRDNGFDELLAPTGITLQRASREATPLIDRLEQAILCHFREGRPMDVAA